MERDTQTLSADAAIGITVNQALFYLDMTRTELSRRVGLSQPSISLKLRGKVTWSVTDLLNVATALGTTPNALLPQPDGEGGWIPAPFVPGYAKAPALAGASAG
ncbi:MAG: helix-turn-helix transcriptional regulator, partial [Acidobacteriota bacterium]|nr:helix-turn-helix transcriptional regulator [Acidobacteriota bacterium]